MNEQALIGGLAWKEWRARRWLLPLLLGLIAAAPFLCSAVPWLGTTQYWELDPGRASLAMLSAFALGVAILSSTFLSPEEFDPARSFLYTLPIPRWRILGQKLRALAIQWLVLTALYVFLLAVWWKGAPPKWEWVVFLKAILFSASAIVFVAILSLHLRSPIVTLVVCAIVLPLVFAILFADGLAAIKESDKTIPLQAREVVNCLVAAALLIGWLFFLFCRTRLLELSLGARSLLGLLFAVIMLEIFFTIFLCDWRDLAFLVFGI
ncbi:MAG: hypothetical protein NTW86_16155 [Candidatus Sumerlaeota bacterium]|nr:hypothetical protein [Candidatus Sumerlaeota bacterium]